MKKLGKLTINPEKVIKNEELVNLRGGYGGEGGSNCCECVDMNNNTLGYIAGSTASECWEDCQAAYPGEEGAWSHDWWC